MGYNASQTVLADDNRSLTLYEHGFRAMNTDIRIVAMDSDDARTRVAAAEDAIHAFEARFSRFLPESELSALNAADGVPVRVSAAMFALLECCLALYGRTGGIFNPAVLQSLEAAGYDRSFERVDPIAAGPAVPSTPVPPFDRIALDGGTREVHLPGAIRIDLGGIGKSYAVEEAMALLTSRDALIDAGGDIAARGDGPDGDGWIVAVADPWDPATDLAVVRLRDEAIATSTTMRRRWLRGGDVRHHIIDPRTGESAQSGLAQVSVLARSAIDADVFAKCALILGERDAARLLEANGYAALFVRDDGSRVTTRNWPTDGQPDAREHRSANVEPAPNTDRARTAPNADSHPAFADHRIEPNRRTPR